MRTKLDAVSLAAVLVTVVAFSATAPLTAYATGSALALALGRNALGLLTLGPVFMLIRRREVRRVFRGERSFFRKEQRRAVVYGVLAGTALAAHFATFMSSTRMTSGDCVDNAMMESFWARVQVEPLNRRRWRTRLELSTALFEYLEIFHNRQRRHSALGMLSAVEYELRTPPVA
ncbi:integrase core domain-containing protein [Streptomyces sp. GESEQ-35]|uniref:integrase core domain-containing protein n=1 Tax=Streptomyces sp. GESEQ-35 TaxID=2812657 RepID=UPI001B31CCD4